MGSPNETRKVRRTRTSDRTRHPLSEKPRGSKTVCLPIGQERYKEVFENPTAFRAILDEMYENHPDLFPKAMGEGYTLHDLLDPSRKLPDVRLRRFKLRANQEVYTIRPSYVLPYMTGYTDDVEKGLFLLSFDLPYWAIARVFGHNAMYWERLAERLGHNSLVGSTVRQPETLPEHLLADEKHTHLCGEKVYIATTVANECVLGAAVSPSAGQEDLQEAYAQFKREA